MIDTDNTDALPLLRLLSLESQSHEAVVILALPLLLANDGNCLKPGEVTERRVRYRQRWRDDRNTFGDDKHQIAVMQPALMLRFAQRTTAITRIEQHRYHQWQFFMPSLKVALHIGHRIAYQAESHMFVRR